MIETKKIIEAAGGDWILECWCEQSEEDFILDVIRLLRAEQVREREKLREIEKRIGNRVVESSGAECTIRTFALQDCLRIITDVKAGK